MESASPRRWPDPSRPLPLRVVTVLLLAAFQLVGGAVYAFSSVASGLTRLGFGQLIPVAVFGIAANVGTFVCVHNGFFLDRVGALRSQLVSMLCIVLGYGIIALLAGPGGGGSPLADVVAVLAFLVVGQGGVMGFLAAISHAEGLFPPARRGLVVGTILAGFGVSGGFSAAVFHALDGQVPAYCVFLIAETVVLGSVVAACIHGTLRPESHTHGLGVSPRRDAAAPPPSHVSPPRSGPCSLLRTVVAAARDASHGTVGLLWLVIFLQAGPFLMVVNTLANIVQALASASASSSSSSSGSSANDSVDEGRILRDAVLAFAFTNTSLRIIGGWVTDELARNADWLVHGCGSGVRRARRRRGPSGPSRRTDAERAEERDRLEDAGGGYADGEVVAAELEGGAGVGDDDGGDVVDEAEAVFVRQRAIRGRLVLLIVAAVLAVAALAVLGTTEPTGLVPRVMVGAALIGCAEGLCFAAWPTILRDEEDVLRGAAARRHGARRQASLRSVGGDEGVAASAALSSTTQTSEAPIDGLPRHGFVSRFGVQFALVDSAIGFGSLTFVSVAAGVYRWHRADDNPLCAGRACFADGVWVALASSVLALVPIACLWFDLGTAFSSSTASEPTGEKHCCGRWCGSQTRGSFAALGSSSSTSSSSSSSVTGAVRDVEVASEVRLDDEEEDETEDAPSLAAIAGGPTDADRSLPPSTPMQLQSSRRVPLVLSGGREGEEDGGQDDGELEGCDGPVAWQHIPPVGLGEEEDDGDVEYRFGRGRLVLSPTDADGES